MRKPELHITRDVDLSGAVLVYAFEGWTDAGYAASLALGHLAKAAEAERVAEFDSDALFDYRSRRPVFHVANGISGGLTWPCVYFSTGYVGAERRILLLQGDEPDLNWQGLAEVVAEFAWKSGVSLAVGIGSIPAPVPHTRAIPVISTSPDPSLVSKVGVLEGRAQVPAGVQLAIEQAISDRSVPSMSIWARVPHYLSAMAWPQAAVSLLETLENLVGFHTDMSELLSSAAEARQRIDEAVRNNKEASEYVSRLETLFADEASPAPSSGLAAEFGSVTGEQIASEIEQYLASRSQDDGSETSNAEES